MQYKRILSIQDISCFGQCSQTVALPIISACGSECVILPSAVLSTHTGGFTGFTFRDLTDDFSRIKEHWKSEGIDFDTIYTGYLGSKKQIDLVKEFMTELLKEGGLRIVDPAMADNGKLYTGFDEVYVEEMKSLCDGADFILPNITEAAFLTGKNYIASEHIQSYVEDLLSGLEKLGAKNIILKGIRFSEDKMGVLVYKCESKERYLYETERIPVSAHGTGDCYASVFTGSLMQGRSVEDAASLAADFVVECIRQTIGDEQHKYGVKFERAIPMLVHRLYDGNSSELR